MTSVKVISLQKGFFSGGNAKQVEKFIAECNKSHSKVISVVPINSSAGTESIMIFYES